jgi:hypothetical protein
MSSEYQYKPLVGPDSIRLLEIKPALDSSAEIRCSLAHTTLSKCDNRDIFGNYTALSYVWGSPDKVETIFVDGLSLGATVNLFSALRDLRDDTRSLWLWVDAICINQVDEQEKGRQIRMMGQIYAGARHTVIYLGPGDSNDREPHCLATLATDHRAKLQSELLESLLRKEWFTRVWVFQELVFSTNPWIQCCRSRVKWHLFCTALHSADLNDNVVNSMEAARRSHHSNDEQNDQEKKEPNRGSDDRRNVRPDKKTADNTMLELLESRRGLKVTDPRDLAFAHVGFASDAPHLDITIDYSRPWTRTYKEFAQCLANSYGLALALEYASGDKSAPRFQDLASWVPNWLHQGPKTYSYNKCTGRDTSVTFPTWVQEDNDEVIAACPVISSDTIVSVSSALKLQNIPKGLSTRIRANILSMYPAAWSLDEGDKYIEFHFPGNDVQDVQFQIYRAWRELVRDDNILPPEPVDFDQIDASIAIGIVNTSEDLPELARSIHHCIHHSVSTLLLLPFCIDYDQGIVDRALARMVSGKLALVPVSAQKGDLVVPLNKSEPPSLQVFPRKEKPDQKLGRYYDGDQSYRVEQDQYVFRPVETSNLSESMYEKIRESVDVGRDWPIVPCEYVGGCFLDRTPSHQVRETDGLSKPFIMTLD